MSTRVDATYGWNYQCERFATGLYENRASCVMDAGKVTTITPTNSKWMGTYASMPYRVVSSAARFTYTGPILTASGWFRIYKTGGVKDIGYSTPSLSGMPDEIDDYGQAYWDFTASELMKGVTVFLNPITPDAENFLPNNSTEVRSEWEGIAIFGLGVDIDGSIHVEQRQVIEVTPIPGDLLSFSSTPNEPKNSILDNLYGQLSQAVGLLQGSPMAVTKQIASLALTLTKAALPSASRLALQAISSSFPDKRAGRPVMAMLTT